LCDHSSNETQFTQNMIIKLEDRKLTIHYQNGTLTEAILLARTESKMRVAIKDSPDAAVFVSIDGIWINEDCEPVEIEFGWRRPNSPKEPLTEADCICPKELASRLVRLLQDGDEVECKAVDTLNDSAELMNHKPNAQKGRKSVVVSIEDYFVGN